MVDSQTEKSNELLTGLVNVIEALLFVSSKPMKAKDFAKILSCPEADTKSALEELENKRKNSGIVLLNNNGEYQLSTNASVSASVKNFLNAELREKLTDATVEVLAIIAYRQPISKAEIESIRGVNSQYSIRNLLMRGLIEKVPNPTDARSFNYQTTTEFLMHLGLGSMNELPEFSKLVEHIKLPETAGLAQEPSQPAPSQEEPKEEEEPEIAELEAKVEDAVEEKPSEEKAEEDKDEDEDDDEDDEET